MTAGSETSAGTLEWAMAELMKNPKVMEKAQIELWEIFGRRRNVDETDVQKLAYMQSVIKEMVRPLQEKWLWVLRKFMNQSTIFVTKGFGWQNQVVIQFVT